MNSHFLRALFFLLIVRPVVLVVIGLNLRRRELLPSDGPALVVANHNSHLDALVLMSLFPIRKLRRVRPVAAADFYMVGGWKEWFALQIIGILPLKRDVRRRGPVEPGGPRRRRADPLAGIVESLDRSEIVILFPEGTRGEPEEPTKLKPGVAHLVKRRPDVPVTPVFMHGLGKALPAGEALLVPFFCDVYIGEPFRWGGDRAAFIDDLSGRMQSLAEELGRPAWR